MSKTKATSWQARPLGSQDDPRWTVTQEDGMGFTTLGGNDKKHAKLAEEALNSHNPERDKLAQDFANSVLRETEHFLVDGKDSARALKRPQSIRLAKQASELLNLYSPKGSR